MLKALHRGEQSARRTVLHPPIRIDRGSGGAHPDAAFLVRSGKMVVTGGQSGHHRCECAIQGMHRPPAPPARQFAMIRATVTVASKTETFGTAHSPVKEPNRPTAVSSKGKALMSMVGNPILSSCVGAARCAAGDRIRMQRVGRQLTYCNVVMRRFE